MPSKRDYASTVCAEATSNHRAGSTGHVLFLVVEGNTKFLHIPQKIQQHDEPPSQANTSLDAPVQNSYIDPATEASFSKVTGAGRTVLPFVPVRVKAARGSVFIHTHALLDTGSTNTFCTEHLANSLELKGPSKGST